MNTYTVTTPDGQLVTKRSSRVFTHAVVRRNRGSDRFFINFASSEARADAEARVMADTRDYIEVVPLANADES